MPWKLHLEWMPITGFQHLLKLAIFIEISPSPCDSWRCFTNPIGQTEGDVEGWELARTYSLTQPLDDPTLGPERGSLISALAKLGVEIPADY
jgi:hypothetical protein